MGFFSWSSSSKKVKKDSPSPAREQKCPPSHHKPPRSPPPQLPSHAPPSWYHGDPYLAPPQPIGLLPPPPGWVPQSNGYPAPIVVNQHHYYLGPPPPPSPTTIHQQPASGSPPCKLNIGSVLDLAKEMCPGTASRLQSLDGGVPNLQNRGTQLLNQSAALYDQISDRFNNVMTLIDGDRYVGNEKDLFAWQSAQPPPPHSPTPMSVVSAEKALSRPSSRRPRPKDSPKGQTTAVAASVISGNFFAKVELYANSKLPMDLPPLRL